MQHLMGVSLDKLGKEQIILRENLKLCVEQQITTNKKVDRMEKVVLKVNEIISDMKNTLLSYFTASADIAKQGDNICVFILCHIMS